MINYNFNQQVFCLNTLSNRSSAYNGQFTDAKDIARNTKADILKVLNDKDGSVANNIQNEIGQWTLLWGPEVVAYNGKAINTMYVAANPDGKYVVAIAGTDMSSVDDWCSEDFKVKTKVAWPLYQENGTMAPMISEGTNNGLNDLLSMVDTDIYPVSATPCTALKFLMSEGSKVKGITVTGHSLGGALSPVYALYLYETFANANNIPVYCKPVAGPSPGDIVFAGYYDNRLGANTTRIWNSLDVVPHAWEIDLMQQITKFYTLPGPAFPAEAGIALTKFTAEVKDNNYTHVVVDAPSFTANLYKYKPNIVEFVEWKEEVVCQHICAYADYFQINDFQQRVQTLLKLTSPYFSAGCSLK